MKGSEKRIRELEDEQSHLYAALCEIARQLSRLVDALYVVANKQTPKLEFREEKLKKEYPGMAWNYSKGAASSKTRKKAKT
jgi:hypothetical protein